MQAHISLLSMLSLFHILKATKALTINNAPAITQQESSPIQNISLEAEAESLWTSRGFALSSAQVLESASGSVLDIDTSLSSLNTSLGVMIMCQGTTFGFGLRVQSCINAISNPLLNPEDTRQVTWGRRGTGADRVLPVRFVSRE